MTLEEILASLDSLKDFVNDQQKPTLDRLKVAVREIVGNKPQEIVPAHEVVKTSSSYVTTDMRPESKFEVPQEEVKEEFKPKNVVKEKVKRKPYKRRSPK